MLQMMNVTTDAKRLNVYKGYGTSKRDSRSREDSSIDLLSVFVEGFNSMLKSKAILRLVTIAIIATVVICLSKTVSADSNVNYYKYYQTYTVQNGDTLWKIAGKFAHDESRNEYIKEVAELNDMSGSYVVAGQKLIVPYYSTEFNPLDAVSYDD